MPTLTLGVILLCAAAMAAGAATIAVTNTNDSGAGSFRQALATANHGDTVIFNASLTERPQTIVLTSGQLLINKRLTISGTGADRLIVDANHASRVFYIAAGMDVTISGLTITNGLAPNPSFGGGIYNDHGTVTVNNCIITDNAADVGVGGGIFNEGTLSVNGSTFRHNSSWYGAGIANHWLGGSGTLTVTNSIFDGNEALTEGGGILSQGGILTVSNSTFSSNSATYGGGGISNSDRPSAGSVTFAISNCTFSGNSAGYGGGLNNHGGTLMVTNATFSGNSAGGSTNFISNGLGGAIYNEQAVTVTASTFSGNSATVRGGGIYNAGLNGFAPTTLKIGSTILNAGAAGENIYNDNTSGPATVASLGYNLSNDNGGSFLTAPGDRSNTDPKLGPLRNNGGPTFTHLPASDSPAIDAGDPMLVTDQRGPGFARIVNNRADIGAVEAQGQAQPRGR